MNWKDSGKMMIHMDVVWVCGEREAKCVPLFEQAPAPARTCPVYWDNRNYTPGKETLDTTDQKQSCEQTPRVPSQPFLLLLQHFLEFNRNREARNPRNKENAAVKSPKCMDSSHFLMHRACWWWLECRMPPWRLICCTHQHCAPGHSSAFRGQS